MTEYNLKDEFKGYKEFRVVENPDEMKKLVGWDLLKVIPKAAVVPIYDEEYQYDSIPSYDYYDTEPGTTSATTSAASNYYYARNHQIQQRKIVGQEERAHYIFGKRRDKVIDELNKKIAAREDKINMLSIDISDSKTENTQLKIKNKDQLRTIESLKKHNEIVLQNESRWRKEANDRGKEINRLKREGVFPEESRSSTRNKPRQVILDD